MKAGRDGGLLLTRREIEISVCIIARDNAKTIGACIAAYQVALQQVRAEAQRLAGLGERERQPRLRDYHTRLAELLRQQPAGPAAPGVPADLGKGVVERRLEQRLAGWAMLAGDSRVNERTRRLQIHQQLATSPPVRPEQIKPWLYREVLHADLHDRYLGLGDVLFGG